MKVLKIFGVVVGIHAFALILIFANPGCSSAHKTAPSASDTVISTDASSPAVSVPSSNGSPISAAPSDSFSGAPISFDPNAAATSSSSVRFSPTRPGSAAAGVLEAQPVTDVTPATTYTVVKGDSLWTVAKKNHLSVSELTAANNMKASATVHVGQKIIIPGKAPTAHSHVADAAATRLPAAETVVKTATPAPKGPADSVRHVVKPGETLGAIARKYQVKVGEIATANNISDPAKIRPGMELTIPGWQTPAAKPGRTATRPRAEPAAPQAEVPTKVIPPPGQDLDAGLRSGGNEPPVIQVEQQR
jgi:LysM repeat protein